MGSVTEPTLTYVLIGINVAVALGAFLSGASATGGGGLSSSLLDDGSVSRFTRRPGRLLADPHRRLPARRDASTCCSTCSPSTSWAACSSRPSGGCASGSSTSCRCWRARSGRCCSSPRRRPWGLGRGVRPHGRRRRGHAQPRHQPDGERPRALDRPEPADHLHDPEHLDRRPHRRPDRRRARGGRHVRPAATACAMPADRAGRCSRGPSASWRWWARSWSRAPRARLGQRRRRAPAARRASARS